MKIMEVVVAGTTMMKEVILRKSVTLPPVKTTGEVITVVEAEVTMEAVEGEVASLLTRKILNPAIVLVHLLVSFLKIAPVMKITNI